MSRNFAITWVPICAEVTSRPPVSTLVNDIVDRLFQQNETDRTFLARLGQTVDQLASIEWLMGTIALDHAKIGALDFLIGGITISAFQTFAAASNAEAFRDWRESMTLSSRDPHFGQRIVSEHSVSHKCCGVNARDPLSSDSLSQKGMRRACLLQPEERAFLRSGRFGRGNFLLGLCLSFFELEPTFPFSNFR